MTSAGGLAVLVSRVRNPTARSNWEAVQTGQQAHANQEFAPSADPRAVFPTEGAVLDFAQCQVEQVAGRQQAGQTPQVVLEIALEDVRAQGLPL